MTTLNKETEDTFTHCHQVGIDLPDTYSNHLVFDM